MILKAELLRKQLCIWTDGGDVSSSLYNLKVCQRHFFFTSILPAITRAVEFVFPAKLARPFYAPLPNLLPPLPIFYESSPVCRKREVVEKTEEGHGGGVVVVVVVVMASPAPIPGQYRSKPDWWLQNQSVRSWPYVNTCVNLWWRTSCR